MKKAIKIISVLASVYGLIMTTDGLISFTYFTHLSNIFIDVVLIWSLVLEFSGKEKGNGFYVTKYTATVCITLTFLIYLFILAPVAPGGILHAYFKEGAGSFGVHFVGPVLAIADFLLYDFKMKSTWKHAAFALIPPIAYVAFVVVLAEVFGVRWGTIKAPYNFLNYGAECGWFGFVPNSIGVTTLGIGVAYMIVVLAIIFFLIGLGYLKLKDMRAKAVSNVISL